MLYLPSNAATLQGVNLRTEKKGADLVPAVDVKFEVTVPNSVLADIAPALLTTVFCDEPDANDPEPELTVGPLSYVRDLRIAWPVGIDWEGVGYALAITYGVTGRIVLAGVNINKIGMTPLPGGAVTMTLRVQQSEVEASTVGRLSALLGHDVDIELTPPEPTTVAELFGDVAGNTRA